MAFKIKYDNFCNWLNLVNYWIKLGREMLSVNKKNCHMTQRINIGLKIMKICSINKTRLIE